MITPKRQAAYYRLYTPSPRAYLTFTCSQSPENLSYSLSSRSYVSFTIFQLLPPSLHPTCLLNYFSLLSSPFAPFLLAPIPTWSIYNTAGCPQHNRMMSSSYANHRCKVTSRTKPIHLPPCCPGTLYLNNTTGNGPPPQKLRHYATSRLTDVGEVG